MSFASSVKDELCKISVNKDCCKVSELYGILLMSQVFSHTHIKISAENQNIIKRIQFLFKKNLNINIDFETKNSKTVIEIDNPIELENIFELFGYDHKYYINHSLNRNVVDEDCCAIAFLRGAFLSSGSINQPDKKSHMEISTSHQTLSREIMSLMLDFEIKPKITKRNNHSVIYFKDGIEIEDFLTRLGASNSAMQVMEAKALKEIRNSVNRRVNCETANISKTIDAGMKQIKMINTAVEAQGMDIFPENLYETIQLRIENPDLSLVELGDIHSISISKSAVNHRMRKILDIAKRSQDE